MQQSVLLRELHKEIRRHDLSTFVEDPPSVAQGGKGVIVPGCPCCKETIRHNRTVLDHLTNDVSTHGHKQVVGRFVTR